MKKLPKVLLGLILALGLVFVAGGMLLPASSHVERSISIERPLTRLNMPNVMNPSATR